MNKYLTMAGPLDVGVGKAVARLWHWDEGDRCILKLAQNPKQQLEGS